jgi:hypothetical protein
MRLALVLAAIALASCASPPPAAAPAKPASSYVELENPADGTRIALKRGGELKLVLDAVPVNNLQWEARADTGPVLLPIGTRAYVGKTTNPLDLSAGAWNVFRYRGAEPGNVTLQFDLRRFGEPGPATRTVRYEVSVE